MTNIIEMSDTNPIKINYSDVRLRVLVEEYITQQRDTFTLRGVCSHILYWAMEEGKASQPGNSLFEGDKVCQADCERISAILNQHVREGRITTVNRGNDLWYEKIMK